MYIDILYTNGKIHEKKMHFRICLVSHNNV